MDETKIETDDFLKTVSEFNKVNMAATNQKTEDYYDFWCLMLFDDILMNVTEDRQ